MSAIVKEFPTLYKVSSNGRTQQWTTWVERNGKGCLIWVEHGQKDGKLQQTSDRITEGKNIGRSNETTPEEQAIKEAESKWTKQVDRKGYSFLNATTILKATPLSCPRPMLAKSFEKDGKHILFPCYGQAKLDGIRCVATKGGLFSRQSKKFTALKHIEDALAPIFATNPGIKLDGELYVHGEEFQSLVSHIKRDVASDKSSKVEYHLYDIINDEGYNERYKVLQSLMTLFPHNKIKLVPTFMVKSETEVKKKHKEYTKKRYEGIMLRNMKGVYKIDGRSKDLQKYKIFMDMEFEIVGATENRGKHENQCTFECQTKSGTTFGVKPKGSTEVREKYWTDWKKGKIKVGDKLTVEFFAWTDSENPVPRFPVGKGIRDYE